MQCDLNTSFTSLFCMLVLWCITDRCAIVRSVIKGLPLPNSGSSRDEKADRSSRNCKLQVDKKYRAILRSFSTDIASENVFLAESAHFGLFHKVYGWDKRNVLFTLLCSLQLLCIYFAVFLSNFVSWSAQLFLISAENSKKIRAGSHPTTGRSGTLCLLKLAQTNNVKKRI